MVKKSTQRALCSYICFLESVAINKTGIDVIAAVHTTYRQQAYSVGFIRQNINQTILEFVHWKISTSKP